MKKKVFSLMMTLLLAFIGVAKADVVTIGDGTSTTYVTPFNSLWGYSFVEQVYTADEIGTAGTINSISFYLSSGSQTNSVDVFMKNVSRTEFSSVEDYEPVTASDMVFSGTVTFSSGWSTITLATPFQYDGTSNLMIALHEYTSGYSTLYFNYTDAANKVVTFHSDGANPDPYSLTNYTGNKYTSEKRANIQIDITPGGGEGGEEVVVEIGNGTSNSYQCPFNSLYGYSFNEWIYTASEIGTAGDITSISFNMYSSDNQTNDFVIYMKNVSRDGFTSTTDYETVTASDIVFNGSWTMTPGWSTITLDTPFAYDGTSNLMIALDENTGGYSTRYFYYTTAANSGIAFYSDTYNPDPYALSSYSGTSILREYRANIKMNITIGGDDPEPVYEEGLHTLATYGVGDEAVELIDQLIIERPNGAWMEPYHFQLYNDGDHSLDVLYIDFLHNNGYFSMDEETTEYPFTVANTGLAGAVDLYINTNTEWEDTEVINSLLAVNTNERSTHLYEIIAAPYQPYCPDVWEKAYPLGVLTTGQVWNKYASEMWNEQNTNVEYDLHANYDLPDFEENIPDGYDAVIRFTANHDIMLNAYVRDGENGKVALYRSDFAGEDGPMADNYYDGRPFINIPAGEQPPFEAQLGQGTSTSGYTPFYCFYNYSISAQLYRADELAAAGANSAPMTSISYQCAATNGNTQNGITIWMANVNDNVIPSSSPLASGMTKVYEGSCTPVVGWNEFVFNQGTFSWDGSSNVMVLFQRNNGDWASGISWNVEALSYAASGYAYNDSGIGAYNVATNSYSFDSSYPNYGYTSTNRANTIFKSNGGRFVASSEDARYMANRPNVASHTPMVSYTSAIADYMPTRGNATIILTTDDVWQDGTGYQMLLDADATAYGTIIPETGGLTTSGDASAATYAEFEYKIPTNADGSLTTSNMVLNESVSIQIPAGTYDWCITNPTPGDRMWIASAQGNVGGRADDYEFEEGMIYEFHVYYNDATGNDATDLTITEDPYNPPTPVDPDQPVVPSGNFSAGPVIENLNVLAGTYYLVASSTDPDFEVVINAEELPCPIAPVTNIYPADNASGIPSSNLTLLWTLNDYCNEWRIVFGSTYYPEDEPEHPATYISEWTSNLQESLRITDYVELWDNTNYFWRIEQRSNPGTDYECVTSGPVFGFTTTFDIPQNLQVNGAGETNIFETEEDVTLTWNRIYDRNRNNDRTFRRYRIYWNGELYAETTENDVTELSYTIPNSEFHYNMVPHVPELFNVTAVYDEGESPMSNTVAVHVSGYGTISGTAYEQDGVTPIGGVTVIVNGTNEFGGAEEYTFTTDENGYYEGEIHVGIYNNAMAYMDGYQDAQTVHPLPFNIVYQQETPNVDFIIDETFYYPAHVCARTAFVPGVEGDTLVQVWWEGWASDGGGFVPGGAFEAQIGDGTSTLTYAPFHTLWNYSLSQTLYRAEELTEAGVTGAAMTSLSYYVASTTCTTPQNNISIWMANVPENELTTTSYTTNNMTLVYTGNNVLPVAGQWNEFVFNEGNFAWDGQSNIVILCARNNGSWQGSVSWQTHNPGFLATTYAYSDTNNGYNVATTPETGMYTSSTNRPNIIMKAGGREAAIGENRALHHFNIYRTDCYNDGPYNSENTVFLASVWRPDTSYFDVQWPEVPVGVYKWGVSAVYSGNQADNPNNPRVDYPFEERESEIMWSDQCGPCIDKDMQTDITVNVVCNSADSPEGCVVSFTNLNEGEQFNHPQPSITLDASGFQAVTPFRKGDYLVTVYLPGYELLQVEESIWGHRDLRYVLTEIIYGAKNLYVSRTGWAMWEPETWEDYPIPSGAVVGPSIIDFETGDFSQFAFDNSGSYPWTVANGGRGYCMRSGNAGVASSTSTISATVNYTMAGTVSFDYNSQGEGTSWDVSKFMIDGVQMFSYGAVGTWNNYTADVAAGEHTFSWSYTKDGSVNPTGDCFMVDNINFNIGGSRAVAEERHLEGYKIMCTSLDDEPIFNHNTPVDQPFCQLTTVDPWSGQPMLIEGEFYKVKVATIYSTGQSPWCEPVIWQYEPCDHWGPVDEVTAGTMPQGNHIEWVFEHGHNQWINPDDPGQGGEASTFSVNFDEGLPEGWTTIDANNDNYNWVLGSQIGGIYLVAGASLAGSGHNESEDMMCSGSYSNATNQAITPDNYLVTPQVTITEGSMFSFWACAQDASYAAEHFGVFVSDNGTSDWTEVQSWTMTAKSGGDVMSIGRGGNTRAQGSWYQKTVDLSAFAGQKYIAIRHFSCNDQFILNIDDVELAASAKSGNDGISLYHDQEVYRQYADDGVLLNFLGIDNVGFRAYLLFNIMRDNRFTLTAENAYGQFVLNAAYEMDNFMGEFESFYEATSYEFSLFTKMDIYNKLTEWKNGVSPDFYNSIIMDVALSNARVENDQCINSLPFCTTDVIEFEAASTSSTAQEEGMDDGCIGSSYNPSFYHMRIHDAGPFVIHMEGHDPNNGTTRDIDFCMWGPYTEQEVMSGYACTHLTGDKIMDCCYSASYTEDCYLGYPDGQHQHNTSHGSINYHVPAVGEYYILMITNFSQQPCVINFTKTEGEGETDCDIVTPSDILGFLITLDGEYLTIVGPDEREYTHEGEFGEHEYCVRPIYPGPAILPDTNYYFSMGCPVCSSTNGDVVEVCDPGNPIYAEVNAADDQVHLWWGEQPTPPEPEEGDTFVYDFENGSLDGLVLIDADGDGYNWNLASATMGTGYGHNASSDMVFSQSYDNNYGALTPDNYIVFPQSNIVNGSTFSFYACGQDAGWASEHFGVAVSTTGTNATDFTTIAEWTMTAKGTKAVRDGRDQGNWYQYTVDLSDYAGMPVYIAIRHFNCTDMFYLDVDDVELSMAAKSNRDELIGYNIYRSTDNVDYVLIATVDSDVTEYFDAPGAGTYYYKVTALYENCESDPAISGENPDQDYVVVGVTGVGENSDNVNLFPNPTKGNVTIQAMNMHRITVVSVLGQVVFDTELDQDEYILNMAKFNTGMYMVRVYTDEGVTVKRVTVLH